MIAGTVTWGIVGAQGRIRLATVVEFVSSWFIAIPCSAISLYVFNYNLLGFVASLIFGYTVGGVAMGFIILRSDWNALSQSVIARNAIEGVTWEDNDWEELPPHVQQAALSLGYTKQMWNNDQEPPSNERDWDELSPREKEAAKIMGFNRSKWDDESDTSDGESKVEEKGKYDNYSWKDLPPDARKAAEILGYTKKLWDCDKEPASCENEWNDLSPIEQGAAIILGYDKRKWDGEAGQELKQQQKILGSDDACNDQARNGQKFAMKTLYGNSPVKGNKEAQSKDTLSKFDETLWKDLPIEIQAAAKTLGYNAKMWDNDEVPASDNKYWHKLTPAEKEAAQKLGYNQRTWDDDSSSDSSSDGNEQAIQSKNTKPTFDDIEWADLPVEVQAAAKTLGYTSKMWDNDGSPPSDEKWWHKLTAEEQRAATILGYNEKTWNDDSSSSSEENGAK